MGLLDDAIREHLELKRRHGAADEEVTRLEAEVLGPVRPEPAPEPPATPAAELADEEDLEEEPPLDEPEPELPPAAAPAAQAAADPVPHGFTDDEPWLDEPDEVPARDALHHPRRPQPTTEFSAEERAEAEGEGEFVSPDEEPAEDVLEETPEFLQETPEHDRLWFEQKPPRDFDFNG